MAGALVLLVLVVILGSVVAALYNGLVARRNGYRNAFSQIDVQLRRRHDLVPNLVETTRAYLKHERETLDAVIQARAQAAGAARGAAAAPGDARAMQVLAGAEGALTSALSRLVAVAEAYPDLKANGSVAQLFEELSSTENRVAFARQAYNDAVMEYNVARESFPASAIAGTFGFTEAAPYEAATEVERAPVRVAL
ncbi:MAG TPA: LemA family protein [Anaeromyxobacteraceae bacterium]|nr:LemA family protein [Anaeromyxobacteraceae bacterium]